MIKFIGILIIVVLGYGCWFNYVVPSMDESYYKVKIGMTRSEVYTLIGLRTSGRNNDKEFGVGDDYQCWRSRYWPYFNMEYDNGNSWDDFELRKNDKLVNYRFDKTVMFWWTPYPHYRKE